ncbi:MAG: hypothetical protein OCD76_03870 [Reichenbachiella sp.]
MKIDLNEIWEFMELAPTPVNSDQGNFWLYELVVGDISIDKLTSEDIQSLKLEENYDTELLPSIFTFREILWQPNVYPEPTFCVPQLNILKVFCEEYILQQQEINKSTSPYLRLLEGLAKYCVTALDKITADKSPVDINIPAILGELRKEAFPIIKFFIFHPMTKADYKKDALNRLNYAVKIMLTQYNSKYHDLQDPYWNVNTTVVSDLKQEESSSLTDS